MGISRSHRASGSMFKISLILGFERTVMGLIGGSRCYR